MAKYLCSECGNVRYKVNTLVKHIRLNHPNSDFEKIFNASIKAWCDKWGIPFDDVRDGMLQEAMEYFRLDQ